MDEVLTAIAEAVSTLIIAFADSEGNFFFHITFYHS
jgi:hypothetical protein